MGNSNYPKAAIKSAISSGDLDQLRGILKQCDGPGRAESVDGKSNVNESRMCTECTAIPLQGTGQSATQRRVAANKRTWLLSQALNKKGDHALTLAIRSGHHHMVEYFLDNGCPINAINKEQETALDVLLAPALPGEGDILHNHFCPYSHASESQFKLPEEAKTLLKRGAKGPSLHKLILHVMKDESQLKEISELIRNIQSEDNFRLSGLLLQVAIWFDRVEMAVWLLEKGVDPENFWRAPFIPTIVPNTEYHRTVDVWENMSNETEGEYVLSCPDKVIGVDTSAGLQSLKLSFVQDWRADWYDGEKPESQYRAGLLLTIEGAVIMIKSANSVNLLDRVVDDVMQYLPPMCGGPDLKESPVIPLLVLAGYEFAREELLQLSLKYNMDFEDYLKYTKQAKSLKQMCRLSVRNNCVNNVFFSVPRLLCLPVELRNYLFLNEIA